MTGKDYFIASCIKSAITDSCPYEYNMAAINKESEKCQLETNDFDEETCKECWRNALNGQMDHNDANKVEGFGVEEIMIGADKGDIIEKR